MTSQAKRLLTTEAAKFLREDRLLVYHYRANGSPVVKNGLAVIPRAELENILRTNPALTRTTKPLPPRAKSVEIYQRDLLPSNTPATGTASGAPAAAEPGNAASNVAGIKFPVVIWLEGLLRGKGKGWREVVVLCERVGGGAPAAAAAGV